MARILVEAYRGESIAIGYWGTRDSRERDHGLIPHNVLMVSVASFTFKFVSVQQIRDYLGYYERNKLSNSRIPIAGDLDHWEVQRWFERLPMYLLESSKRAIIKALTRALAIAESGAFSQPI